MTTTPDPAGTPLVSVIIPNYNYARTLRLCLESVRAQTHPNIELIVVDDRSTDNSAEIAREYGAEVTVTPTNIGAPAARNLGAERARGSVLFFLDSDVALAPDAVANAAALLSGDPAVGGVCGTYDAEPLIRDSLVEEVRSLQLYAWIHGGQGDISTVYTALFAVRRDVWDEIGGFDPALRHSENADYGHRLSARYRIVLTGSVHGRHDHDDTLRVLISKMFHRARLHMPLYLRRPDFSGGPSNGLRGWATLAALGAVLTAPLAALAGPLVLLLPAVLLVLSVVCDARMYGMVLRRKGLWFWLYFTAVWFLVNVTVALAVFAGLAQWLLSARFRHTYDRPLPAATTARSA
ncbi:glycosyltransferase family 2 protein [Streptomyces sp. YIM 98790]|uniref:glycosyltransferase family 2 protein n=1 Tax=Streptomyces sp. YIM 98790 TaxID=2689077 RepID=UPI001409F623|nr:glycosyltransferase family 2 protein [Streptomyces sp. YIM 98790]